MNATNPKGVGKIIPIVYYGAVRAFGQNPYNKAQDKYCNQ